MNFLQILTGTQTGTITVILPKNTQRYTVAVGRDPGNTSSPVGSPATAGKVKLNVIPHGFNTPTDMAGTEFDLTVNRPVLYVLEGAFDRLVFVPSGANGNYRISVAA